MEFPLSRRSHSPSLRFEPPSAGAEIEAHLYRDNGEWLPKPDTVVLPGSDEELQGSISELASIAHGPGEGKAAVAGLRMTMTARAFDEGFYPVMTGAVPYWSEHTTVNATAPRYVPLINTFGSPMARHTYTGVHIHRAVDAADAWGVVNQSRALVWTLNALFNNSPIEGGKPVPEGSRRVLHTLAMPSWAIAAPHYLSAEHYLEWRTAHVARLGRGTDMKSEHSWVRMNGARVLGEPSDKPVTVEVRTVDTPLTDDEFFLAEQCVLAVLARAERRTKDGLADADLPPDPSIYATMAHLSAMADVRLPGPGQPRSQMLDPFTYELKDASECVALALEAIGPELKEMGVLDDVTRVANRIIGLDGRPGLGAGAVRQRALLRAVMEAEGSSEGDIEAVFNPRNQVRVEEEVGMRFMTNLVHHSMFGTVAGVVNSRHAKPALVRGVEQRDVAEVVAGYNQAVNVFCKQHASEIVEVDGLPVLSLTQLDFVSMGRQLTSQPASPAAARAI